MPVGRGWDVDDVDVVESNIAFLWSTFTRFEPAADIYAADIALKRHHPSHTPPVVFDCRKKPGYPDELVADQAVSRQVTQRWEEYFPNRTVEGEEDPLGYRGFALKS